MAGYTRQSSYTDSDVINASDSNDEFDQLVAAFNATTGHSHDGTSAEGPIIGLIGDAGETTPKNKIVVDTDNNVLNFFVNVASTAVNQVTISDGVLAPVTNNDVDLGTATEKFKDGFFSGDVSTLTLTLAGTQINTVDTDLSAVSASDDSIPSALAVKTYVDAQVTAQDLDFQADTGGALNIDLDGEALTLTGGTGITTAGAGNEVTFSINTTVVTKTDTQTLTNKTLTAPNITGATISGGTVDGRTISTDGTKLDTIETNADVTDTVNVTAAGALMDSELTNLTAVKALDQGVATTDSPTFASITVTSTVDGRDVSVDGTKLDTIETNADVTDTTNVTAAGALMDSELTDITAVKALDQGVATTDTPTFAGIITTGNVDGRDVSTDGTKLDTIEAGADVTDTANVAAAGALMDSNNLSDLSSASTARTNLDVDQAGTALALAIALG